MADIEIPKIVKGGLAQILKAKCRYGDVYLSSPSQSISTNNHLNIPHVLTIELTLVACYHDITI